jgi:hypothetical protein
LINTIDGEVAAEVAVDDEMITEAAIDSAAPAVIEDLDLQNAGTVRSCFGYKTG